MRTATVTSQSNSNNTNIIGDAQADCMTREMEVFFGGLNFVYRIEFISLSCNLKRLDGRIETALV